MKRPVVGILMGTAVLFAWGAVSWMVLPWHNKTIKKLPEEQLITDTLKTVVTSPGFYSFPGHPGPESQIDEGAWREKYRRGPIGVVIFSPTGKEPMTSTNFLAEIAGDFVIALISMILLSLSRDRVQNILPRAVFVMSLGLVAGMATHMTYWNWFNFPLDVTVVNILDLMVGFLLLGFSQAKFVPET